MSDVKRYSWRDFFLVLTFAIIAIGMVTILYIIVFFSLSQKPQRVYLYTNYDSTLGQAERICGESNATLFVFSKIPSNGYARYGIFEFEATLTDSFNSVKFSELCLTYGWLNESNQTLVKATKWYSDNE